MSPTGLFLAATLVLTIAAEVRADSLCGNGALDSGESCDPPGTFTCPTGSPTGSFLVCGEDCTCPAQVLDKFRCYGARGHSFPSLSVALVDELVTSQAKIVRPQHFCNPADKDGEGVIDPTAHLTCYQIKELKFARREAVVRDQFGEHTLTYIKPKFLCAPSKRNGVPSALNMDHFKCYKARSKEKVVKRTATIEDDDGNAVVTILKPAQLCNPVDKNGEGIKNNTRHLLCYAVKASKKQPKHAKQAGLYVNNQFGPGRLDTKKEETVCLPALKELF